MFKLRLILLLPAVLFAISCSSSNVATESERSDRLKSYPSWYQSSLHTEGSDFYGYAAAIAADSSSAAEKAVMQARANLEAGLSVKVEESRKKMAERSDNYAILKTPEFILHLRKAEEALSKAARPVRSEVAPTESGNGYRGFAEVVLSKTEVTDQLDRALASQSKAWNLLKRSQAYKTW